MEVVKAAINRIRAHAAVERLQVFLTSPVMRLVIPWLWILDLLLFFSTFYWFYDPFMFYNHCDKRFGIEKLDKLSKGECKVKDITVEMRRYNSDRHYLVICAYSVKVESERKSNAQVPGFTKYCKEPPIVHNIETSQCRSLTFTSPITSYESREQAESHRCEHSHSMNTSSTDYTYQKTIPCFVPPEICPDYVLDGEVKVNYCVLNHCSELVHKTTIGMTIALSLYILLVINCVFCCPCKDHRRNRNRVPREIGEGGEIVLDQIEMKMLPGEAGYDS